MFSTPTDRPMESCAVSPWLSCFISAWNPFGCGEDESRSATPFGKTGSTKKMPSCSSKEQPSHGECASPKSSAQPERSPHIEPFTRILTSIKGRSTPTDKRGKRRASRPVEEARLRHRPPLLAVLGLIPLERDGSPWCRYLEIRRGIA